jgi:K+-sensing histidine kinase KdpD
LILEANPSNEIKELAEFIYQSSNQFLYIEKFLKLLKEQDEVLQSSLDLKGVEFEGMIATVESLVQQLLTKIKLNVSIEVPKAELFIDEELLIRVLVNLIDNA